MNLRESADEKLLLFRDEIRLPPPARFAILPWSLDVSWQYGEIYRQLAATGKVIGANDLWIAAHCLQLGLTLITNNEREFRRIPNLPIENWTQ